MATHSQTRELIQALLELSNTILAAVIGGAWDEVDDLERQRAALFERVFNDREMSSSDRIFLAGAMEHIRVVDASTRNFLAMVPGDDWLDAMCGENQPGMAMAPPLSRPVEMAPGYRVGMAS